MAGDRPDDCSFEGSIDATSVVTTAMVDNRPPPFPTHSRVEHYGFPRFQVAARCGSSPPAHPFRTVPPCQSASKIAGGHCLLLC